MRVDHPLRAFARMVARIALAEDDTSDVSDHGRDGDCPLAMGTLQRAAERALEDAVRANRIEAAAWASLGLPERLQRIANCKRYDAKLGDLELTPNGDDYTALLDMLNGAPYQRPHIRGR